MAGTDTTFGLAAAWLGVVAIFWLLVWRRPLTDLWTRAHPAAAIALAATIARLVPTLTLDRGLPYDISAHWWIGVLTLGGQDVYTAPMAQGRYPYPPLHSKISALAVLLSGHDRTLFLIVDKAIPGLCGVAIALLVRAAARRLGRDDETALRLGLLYAVNPLPMLVTAYHGQFEEIPLLAIVLAFYLLLGERRRSWALSALCLGLAVAYKTWPLLFLPPLLLLARGWSRRLLYVLLTLAPLAVSAVWYELAFRGPQLGTALHRLAAGPGGLVHRLLAFVDGEPVLHRLLGYKGSEGFCWGYVSVIRKCWIHPEKARPNSWVLGLNVKVLLVALILAGIMLLWRRRPLEGLLTFPLVFLLFGPGWGPNYTVWALPFALLIGVRTGMGYTLLLLPLVALTYLDSLYAAYAHNAFGWAVLKPTEAALGLLAWLGVGMLVVRQYVPLVRRIPAIPWSRATAHGEAPAYVIHPDPR